MKLVLIQPPVQDFYDTDIRLQPIGLAYLKGALKKHLPEIQVVIRDFHHGWGRRTVPIPKELAYLKDYYPWPDQSPFCTFHPFYHFGADFETILSEIRKERPDMVGISSLFSPYYREVIRIARDVKAQLGVPVLLGGSHVSAMPELMLSREAVDFVIRGEGERPLVEFLKQWTGGRDFSGVANLGYKEGGQVRLNDIEDNYPIEEIPQPDLSDLTAENYLFEKRPLSFLITSRSCPHRCTFCSVHKTFGFKYRRRSVQHVLEEIQSRYREGIRVFDFEDDNLTFYKGEMKELCRRLIEIFPAGDVQFVAMNGISYLSLDGELLELMKQAGFTHLNLALVSSDVTVRETTKRPHTIEKYLQVVNKAAELKFEIVSYQILGLPNESLESMIQTLAFAARLPVLLGASCFYLTPNSPIASGFPPPSEKDVFLSRLTAMAIETDHFQREDIYTLFVTTRILNFLKGLDLDASVGAGHTSLLQLSEALEAARGAGGRSALGAELLERVLNGEGLFAATAQGWKPLPLFRPELFFKVWNETGFITTQAGRRIALEPVSLECGSKC